MNCFKPAVDFAISYLCKPLILVYRAELELFDTIRYGVTYVISCSIPSGPNNELVCNIHNTRCFKRAVKTPPPPPQTALKLLLLLRIDGRMELRNKLSKEAKKENIFMTIGDKDIYEVGG